MGKLNVDPLTSKLGHNSISAPAGLEALNNVALFDASLDEQVLYVFTLDDYAGSLSILLPWYMKSTNTGNIILEVQVAKIEEGDQTEALAYDTVNSSGAVAVPGTVKDQKFTLISLSNDGSPSGAIVTFFIRVVRKGTDGGDTATGDLAHGPGPAVISYTST